MQIGNVWLKIDGFGSCIPLERVTPAEVAILNENHEINAKTNKACFDLIIVGDEKRENEVEINRLREKYVNAKNKKGESLAVTLYPGKSPMLPQTFKEVGLEAVGGQAEGQKENVKPAVPPKTDEKPPDHPQAAKEPLVKK